MAAFAAVLRQHLTIAHLSAYELAKRSGLSEMTISRYLSGKATNPRWEAIQRIATALRISTEQLRTGEDRPC